jgi:hypothetical protein
VADIGQLNHPLASARLNVRALRNEKYVKALGKGRGFFLKPGRPVRRFPHCDFITIRRLLSSGGNDFVVSVK